MSAVRRSIPWWFRIAAKIVLSRLPISYRFWKYVGVFEHGDMNQVSRAWETLQELARLANAVDGSGRFLGIHSGGQWGVLELGPGDSVGTALVAYAMGATQVWLVDSGDFATSDTELYARINLFLGDRGLQVLNPWPAKFDEMLAKCEASYLTCGIDSLRSVPTGSVKFCFSNAVLEHVERSRFDELLMHMNRVMPADGVAVHRVDLMDHLGGGLNNLRFPERVWEGRLFRNSGFYTNRLRFGDLLRRFTTAGFQYRLARVTRWDRLPLRRESLAAPFADLPEEDLLVSGFDVVLRKL